MPYTLKYRPSIIEDLISEERINSYRSVFHPKNDVELVGTYLWNAHVCGALSPLVGAAEVALRNSIDQALQKHLGMFWWSGSKLKYKSYAPGGDVPAVVKSIKENFAKATLVAKKERKRRYNIPFSNRPQHADIIAKTEFSTWEHLLDNEFMGNGFIWPSRLGVVFKGPWRTSQAGTTLTDAREAVRLIREFRNRLYHHEPVWKKFGVLTEGDAIVHLHEKIEKTLSFIALINPEKRRLLEKSGLVDAAKRACSINEIRRFQHVNSVKSVKSIGKLVSIAEACVANNTTEKVRTYRKQKVTFLIVPT